MRPTRTSTSRRSIPRLGFQISAPIGPKLIVVSPLLRARKDLVTTDAEPLDVRLTGLDLGAVAEGGAPIARVGHLPNVPGALNPLDAQGTGWLPARPECIDEFAD